jgi:hypothetical protein
MDAGVKSSGSFVQKLHVLVRSQGVEVRTVRHVTATGAKQSRRAAEAALTVRAQTPHLIPRSNNPLIAASSGFPQA